MRPGGGRNASSALALGSLTAGLAGALALSLGTAGAGPVAADPGSPSAPVTVVATASYVDATAPPRPLAQQGDLPVGGSAAGETARAVIALDLPADATSARVTLRVADETAASYGTPQVSACRVLAAWQPGAGQPLTAAPAVDCTAVGPVTGPGPWTFDLDPLVRAWQRGAPRLGVAFVQTTATAPAGTTFNTLGGERVGTAGMGSPGGPGGAGGAGGAGGTTGAGGPATPTDRPAPAPGALTAAGPVLPAPVSGSLALAAGTPAGPQFPSPTAPTAPPAVLAAPAAVPGIRPASAALPVAAGVWLLLPLSLWGFLALARAVSPAADQAAA